MADTETTEDSISDADVQYKIEITPKLVASVLGPYLWDKVAEQLTAVAPISLFLVIFQLTVLQSGIAQAVSIGVGLGLVILGLMFFMDGLRLGLMPLGDTIGVTLPRKAAMWLILGFAFVLGIAATYAEPAIATLKEAGASVDPADPRNARLLFEMLNQSSAILVLAVGVGVGLATVQGIYRFVKGWSLKVFLYPALGICSTLTIIAFLNPGTRGVISLAWDTGAVTTGPVTVPLVLALGLGVSSQLGGESDSGMSGFGVVTLASLWPIIMVLTISMIIWYTGGVKPLEESRALFAEAQAAKGASGGGALAVILANARAAVQAIGLLAGVLFIMQLLILREKIRGLDTIIVGLVLCILGFGIFGIGLSQGLSSLGGQVGGNVPGAFTVLKDSEGIVKQTIWGNPFPETGLYGTLFGKVIAILFAFILGYASTLAEPALNALGATVEEVTSGAFKKALLMHAVATGVALGLSVGIAKIMFQIEVTFLIIPAYALLAIITWFSEEKYINIGWDSAGVTTGPITVPLVLAMGLGVGQVVGALEGFGMLSMASIGPIMTVLTLGLIVSRTSGSGAAAAEGEEDEWDEYFNQDVSATAIGAA